MRHAGNVIFAAVLCGIACPACDAESNPDEGLPWIGECKPAGQAGCLGNNRVVCLMGEGQLHWVVAATCSLGCQDGLCLEGATCGGSCDDQPDGTRGCREDTLVACLRGDGCSNWVAVAECSMGCSDGRCVGTEICNDPCAVEGSVECREGSVYRCVLDGACLSWALETPCENGCTGGTCNPSCVDPCPGEDVRGCRDAYQTICTLQEGCLVWVVEGDECPYGCESGECMECPPDCDGRDCGDDGCGRQCGTCDENQDCINGQCVCVAEHHRGCCGDAVCWFDSCDVQGAVVENCPYGCSEGTCKACEPDCEGRDCGEDGCGDVCGTCKGGSACLDGVCKCMPQDHLQCCGNAVCWVDSCGTVGAKVTNCPYGCDDGECLECVPFCSNAECGSDGCGGTCGPGCSGDSACNDGYCAPLCTTDSNCSMVERCGPSTSGPTVCQLRPLCDAGNPCASSSDMCVQFSDAGICMPRCTPSNEASVCGSPSSACLPMWDGSYVCLPVGDANLGEPCQYLNDCSRGHLCLIDQCMETCAVAAPDCDFGSSCFDLGAGEGQGICWEDGNLGGCDPAFIDCAGGMGLCLDEGDGTGLCYPNCDVFAQNCAAEDAACYVMTFDNPPRQVCYPRFTNNKQEGETCEYMNECGRGLQCSLAPGATTAQCMPYCASGGDCRVDQVCAEFASLIGLCVRNEEHVGETRYWWVSNVVSNSQYQIQTTVIAESLNARIYLEQGQVMTEARAQAILEAFENRIYPSVRRYFGPEPNPGIDGIPQVMIVYLDIQDGWTQGSTSGWVGGYFSGINQLTEAEALGYGLHSNEAEVVFMDTYPSDVNSDDSLSTLAHEFQHMVHWQAKGLTDGNHKFVNEGMSMPCLPTCNETRWCVEFRVGAEGTMA